MKPPSTTASPETEARAQYHLSPLLIQQTREVLVAAAKERSRILRDVRIAKHHRAGDRAAALQADLESNDEIKAELEGLLILHSPRKLRAKDSRPGRIATAYKMAGMDEVGEQWIGCRPPVKFWGEWSGPSVDWRGVVVKWDKPSNRETSGTEESIGPRGESV